MSVDVISVTPRRRWRPPATWGHTEPVKAVPLIAAIFVLAVVLERADADTDLQFWVIVAAGVAGVVATMGALRSRGGIGATGTSHSE